MPLVARREPYRPRHRAGIGTLAASPGCRAFHGARTLHASLDMYFELIAPDSLACQGRG